MLEKNEIPEMHGKDLENITLRFITKMKMYTLLANDKECSRD